MNAALSLLTVIAVLPASSAQEHAVYAEPAGPLHTLDVYAMPGAEHAPVMLWIHGGGWETGDKSDVAQKPQFFVDRGFVFVSINYRLLPKVEMIDIFHDVAKSFRWVHDHIAEYGGEPKRVLVGGHSAGAQLAALLCTDERFLKAEGLPLTTLKGCVPVDGDTYDVPLQVATSDARYRSQGQPTPKMGYAGQFGTPEQQRDLSAVRHIARNKGIPPFLILHVADHTDTTAQAHRLWSELREAGVEAKVFGASGTDHVKLDSNLGVEGDPATFELFAFVERLR